MTKHIANIVTGCRMVGSILMLFFPAFSAAFYALYLFCGLSDMIDGTIARKTQSASEFGAKIDTAADLVFVTISFIKILPAMSLPPWVWTWGGIIALIRLGNCLRGYLLTRQLIALHTIANKLTGSLLFLWPFTLSFFEANDCAVVVCAIATFAAIQEGGCIAAKAKAGRSASP